jgi:hypothetical protein
VLERELTLEEAYPSAAYLHAALCRCANGAQSRTRIFVDIQANRVMCRAWCVCILSQQPAQSGHEDVHDGAKQEDSNRQQQ